MKKLIVAALAASLLGAAPQARKVPSFDHDPLTSATIKVLSPTLAPSEFSPLVVTALGGAPYTKDGGYLIVLGAVSHCDASTSCTFATVEGEPTSTHVVPAGYHPVKFHDGRTGFYSLGRCGANCAGSFNLLFFRDDAEYTISVKAGRLADGLLIERGLKAITDR